MEAPLGAIVQYILPLTVAGVLHHFLIIRRDLFRVLAVPIDGGLRFGGQPLFGSAKTWRGIVVMVFIPALIWWLFPNSPSRWFAAGLGAVTGLGYALGELPNSFLKRRLGLSESSIRFGRGHFVFNILDQVDSVTGAIIALAFVQPVTLSLAVWLFMCGTLVHLFLDGVLYFVGYKKAPNSARG